MSEIMSRDELKKEVLSYFNELTAIQDELTRNTTLACGEGCSFCCALHITLKPYELLFLTDHIASQPDEVQKHLQTVIDENCRRITDASDEKLLSINFTCPFLKDNSCSIYEVRPTSCRIAHSKSKAVCEEAFHNPDTETPADHISDFEEISRTFEEQFEDQVGEYHDVSDYNMNMALREALKDPQWIQRFIDGEEVFSDDALSRV